MYIVIIFVILLIAFIISSFATRKFFKKNHVEVEDSVSESDFSKDLFFETAKGEEYQVLAKIPSQAETGLIQSILHSAGIPSYSELDYSSGIFGSATNVMSSMSSSKLYVLKKDYDASLLLLLDFLKNNLESIKKDSSDFKYKEVEEKLDEIEKKQSITEVYSVLSCTIFPKEN